MTAIGKTSGRILSVDVIRALTMFLMIFVNDVSGVSNIPAWIEHTAADTDGMGFSDLIFPAFLFIVGLSLPLAIQTRIDKGVKWFSILLHIVLRALALIVMGFFHVNLESYSKANYLTYPVFTIIIIISFFLIWMDYPETVSRRLRYILVSVGVIALLAMAYIYKGGNASNPHGMRPEWWGILGIIGWAYLVSALVYLLLNGNIVLLTLAALVFFAINVLTHMKVADFGLPVIGDASSISLIMGGVLVARARKILQPQTFWIALAIAGIASIGFGFYIRPLAGGISKIYATPAWVFICMGISIVVYEWLIWLIDIKQKQRWFNVIQPAGTSTLTCYLIPYLLYAAFSLLNFEFPAWFNTGTGGMIRSFAIAFLVIGIVGLLEKKHIRLKV